MGRLLRLFRIILIRSAGLRLMWCGGMKPTSRLMTPTSMTQFCFLSALQTESLAARVRLGIRIAFSGKCAITRIMMILSGFMLLGNRRRSLMVLSRKVFLIRFGGSLVRILLVGAVKWGRGGLGRRMV